MNKSLKKTYFSLRYWSCVRNNQSIFHYQFFDLFISQGVQMIGKNGVGKTSFLRSLVGLVPVTGVYMKQGVSQPLSQLHNQSDIIYIGTENVMRARLSLYENIKEHIALRAIFVSENHIDQALEEFQLSKKKHTFFYELSSGQKKRAALTLLSLIPASVWLLDEPFVYLDQEGQSILKKKLKWHIQERQGSVLLTTPQALPLSKDLFVCLFFEKNC